jgi:microcystin-dependent protein
VKRGPFLGAASAVLLNGCGGGHALRALPGVSQTQNASAPAVPQSVAFPADPIPQAVLAHPIIGEARRFDGTTAPAGWLLLNGATLQIVNDRGLFRVLGTIAGGDGKTTFKLPQPKQGWIIAVAGNFPTSPQIFAQVGRQPSAQTSLGPGAQPRPSRVFSPRVQVQRDQRYAAVRREQQLRQSAVRTTPAPPGRVSTDRRALIDQTREAARATVLNGLSAENRSRAEGLVMSVLAGSIEVYDAVRQMSMALSAAESQMVLDACDAAQRALGANAAAHPNAQDEAGRYVMQLAFTSEQLTLLRRISS